MKLMANEANGKPIVDNIFFFEYFGISWDVTYLT